MELYEYQKSIVEEGNEILSKHNMLILALETRTGKSFISLSIAENNGSVLVVTTKSALKDFKSVPDKLQLHFDNITFINYESLHKIDQKEYDVVICDEFHKITAFPKPNIARKRLENFIGNDTKLMLLSGTPWVESSSQLFHALSLHPLHPFAEYKNFYKWFKEHGLLNQDGSYRQKFVGYGRTMNDYSETLDFSEYYKPFTITLTREEAGHEYHTPQINRIYVDMPEHVLSTFKDMKAHGIAKYLHNTFVAQNGASKLSKLQQIASGTCIDDKEVGIVLSDYKADYIKQRYKYENIVILYKYQAEKKLLDSKQLHSIQFDSGTTGVDLSHMDRLIVMTNTFSGANFIQGITRMCNANRDTPMPVDVILATESLDEDILNTVERKQNVNTQIFRK
jgi:hypothetical protein